MMKLGLMLMASAALVATAAPVAAATFTTGPQAYAYSGLARGYYFTAPTTFTITSLFIPTTASSGNQYAEVVRFATAPTFYPVTTNAFTNLGYFANQDANAPITTSIVVNAGDVIGILGTRGDSSTNSYSAGPYVGSIGGLPVTLNRLGFQSTLNAGAAANLFTEANGNYSRVNFDYTLGAVSPSVPEPATWTMMVLGFGMVGFGLRSRRKVSTKVSFA